MITTIAGKELLTTLKTVRFLIVVLTCCLLTPISVWVLSNDYLKEAEDYQGRIDLEERRTAGKQLSINVNRPVPQLSALFRGISEEAANSITLKIFLGWNLPVSTTTQSITRDIFPAVDLAFIIGIVLSALAVMLSFDSVSGEKADSTLGLIMSNSVQRSSIILGKWLGLVLTLWIPFLAGLIISLLVLMGITGLQFSTDNWMLLTLAVLAALAYLALFVLIGIVVSAFSRRRSASIITGLAVWGLLVVLLPQVANAISKHVAPVPTAQEIEKNIRLLYNEFANETRRQNIATSEKAIREDWDDDTTQRAMLGNLVEMGLKNREDVNNLERDYWLQVTGQENAGKAISLISPYSALTQALVSLSDTGSEAQREFLRRAYAYGETYFATILRTAQENPDTDQAQLIEEQPPFAFEGLALERRLNLALPPLATLLIMNIVLVIIAVIAFNRYDPR